MSFPRLRVPTPVAAMASGKAEQAQSAPDETEQASKKPKLLSFDELPEWYQDNNHIPHGYRPVSGSVATSFYSWRYIHNETINIYSHLVPAVSFALGEWYILQFLHSRYDLVTITDDLIFAFFLLTAATCLGLSAAYHTLINHSHAVEIMWLRLDLVGISLLTIGDFVSGIYMVFWCEAVQRRIYWAMTLSLGSLTIFVMVSPWFQGRSWRNFRTFCFVGTGMSGFAPLAHGICLFGFSQMLKQSGMLYYLVEGGLLSLGALIYAVSGICQD